MAEDQDARLTVGDGIIQVAGIWIVPDTLLGNQAGELNFLVLSDQTISSPSRAQSPASHLVKSERAFARFSPENCFALSNPQTL